MFIATDQNPMNFARMIKRGCCFDAVFEEGILPAAYSCDGRGSKQKTHLYLWHFFYIFIAESIGISSHQLVTYEDYGKCEHDIQKMRSSELGYYAPIIVKDNKYYTYEDPDYSITNVPLTDEDLKQMSEAVEVLKQMSGFSTFEDIEDIVNRLEDHVSSMRHHTDPVILLETNERVKGLHFITSIHKAIIEKKQLKITYQSFKTDVPHTFVFSPFLLKEFRNRWFVFGERPRGKFRMENLALDRIVTLDVLDNSL